MFRMITGRKSTAAEIDRLNTGFDRLMESVIERPLKHAVYRGLVEAMDNCAGHAYPERHEFRYPVTRGQWWMSGSVTDGRVLEVIFLDQGATIPATLPPSLIEKAIEGTRLLLKGTSASKEPNEGFDGELIQAAIAIGRTAVGVSGRGYGLATMRELVDEAEDGSSFRILSRKGRYI